MNQKRRQYVPDKKLIKFIASNNPDLYFNYERRPTLRPKRTHIINTHNKISKR